MSRVLDRMPVGERIGIAFSGGLDTSAAVAWMRERGGVPCAYTADLGQYDEPDSPTCPSARPRLRRRDRTPRRLPERSSCTRGSSPCSAAPSTSAPAAARTSTRRRSGGPSRARCSCARCTSDDVSIWGDGSTYKGNDIERFYRYGLLANPDLRIYKPWLDPDFVRRARRPEGDVASGSLRADLPYRASDREGVLDRRQHLGRDARGEGSRAARREHATSSSRSWACATGTPTWRSCPSA